MRFLLIAALLWALIPRVSSAQDEAQQSAERRLFEEATEALRDGDYVSARDLFRMLLERHPTASVRFNLALALSRTGEPVECHQLLVELLASTAEGLSEEVRAAGATIRAECDVARARLVVPTGILQGGSLHIDGQEVEGTLEGHWLDPGPHEVVIRAAGFVPYETELNVSAGETHQLQPDFVPALDHRAESEPSDPPPSLLTTEPTLVDPTRGEEEQPVNLRPRRALWISLAVLVAGGLAAGLAIGLTRQDADPVGNTLFTDPFVVP